MAIENNVGEITRLSRVILLGPRVQENCSHPGFDHNLMVGDYLTFFVVVSPSRWIQIKWWATTSLLDPEIWENGALRLR